MLHTPSKEVILSQEALAFLHKPGKDDFVVEELCEKVSAQGDLLMRSALVVAGKASRKKYGIDARHAVHFLKRYYPASLHTDPGQEYERTLFAAQYVAMPEPIGYDENSFRAAYIPGVNYQSISPFGVDPPLQNIHLAEDLPKDRAAAMWRCLEIIYHDVKILHRMGMTHGDLEMHNIMVTPLLRESHLIDFESGVFHFDCEESTWVESCQSDLDELLQEAVYLQCCLGQQEGKLAVESLKALPRLFRDADEFFEGIAAVKPL